MAYTPIVTGTLVDTATVPPIPSINANLDEMDVKLSSLQRRSKQLFGTLGDAVPGGSVLDIDFPTSQTPNTQYDASILYNELSQIAPVGVLEIEAHVFVTANPHSVVGNFGFWVSSSPSGGFVYPSAGSSSLLNEGAFESVVYAAINPSDPKVANIPDMPISNIPQDSGVSYTELIFKTRINSWGGSAGASGLDAGVAFYGWLRATSSSVGNLTLGISPESYWTLNQTS